MQDRAGGGAGAAPENAADTAGEAEKARQIKEAAAYWSEHQARLRQLLTVDYPAAVSRRNAATPEYPAVAVFARAWKQEAESRFKNASDQGAADDLPLGEVFDSQLASLWMIQALTRSWEDPTAITGDLTRADLTREMLANPEQAAQARATLAEVERKEFHDEAAAQQVEAMQTGAELAAYAKAAQARYVQATEQEMNVIGAGERGRAMANELVNVWEEMTAVGDFLDHHNQEVKAILDEYAQAEGIMNGTALAEASSEDAEARRLLTEWKETRTQWQTGAGDALDLR